MNWLIAIEVLQLMLLLAVLNELRKFKNKVMATLADLDQEITDDLAGAATEIETAVADLIAKQPPTVDTQPQIDRIKTIAAALRTAATSGQPTVTVPPPPTP